MSSDFADLFAYLEDSRDLVTDQIRKILPADRRHAGHLYELMLDYPLRYGKALRPAICIAVCRAQGGSLSAVLPSAAVLELYHNAFLIHDDVEDRSFLRRSEHTLNRMHGAPTAVNVGDGMLALTFQPLIDNIALVGLGKSLRILRIVARMARATAEGQMIELDWIREALWRQSTSDYVRLVHKKTSWYSFIAPAMIGAVVADLAEPQVAQVGRIMIPLGVAFQIQDDILNLIAEEATYGKDLLADLWEGKHTLILMHALGAAAPAELESALSILAKPQPSGWETTVETAEAATAATRRERALLELIEALADQGELSQRARVQLKEAAERGSGEVPGDAKTAEEIEFLRELIMRYDSVGYAGRVAHRYADRFQREIGRLTDGWRSSTHKEFLLSLARFTVNRRM
jgi:geranylgeranyl diphosphate synthase, type II